MREIRLHGSEGGGAETNRSFLPLRSVSFHSRLGRSAVRSLSAARRAGGRWLRRPLPAGDRRRPGVLAVVAGSPRLAPELPPVPGTGSSPADLRGGAAKDPDARGRTAQKHSSVPRTRFCQDAAGGSTPAFAGSGWVGVSSPLAPVSSPRLCTAALWPCTTGPVIGFRDIVVATSVSARPKFTSVPEEGSVVIRKVPTSARDDSWSGTS